MNYNFRTPLPVPRSLGATLHDIESAQLVRKLLEEETAYLFKHALVQDGAYSSLTRAERKRLHLRVAETLVRVNAGALDENAALLAYHFEHAEEWTTALEYLQRAAEWARRGGAYREQIDFLHRALAIAPRANRAELTPMLLYQRGLAFGQLTRWQDARQDLARALELLSPEQTELRAQALLEMATVMQWLWDAEGSITYANAALVFARTTNDNVLEASALAALAFNQISSGAPRVGLQEYERAFARAGDASNSALARGMELSGNAFYWIGEYDAAIERGKQAVARGRALGESDTVMRALSNLALAYMGRGDYADALRVFEEARAFGQEHGIAAWLARGVSIESHFYFIFHDFARAEKLSLEARELARAANFPPAIVSAAIDLMLNYTTRGELTRAERFRAQTQAMIVNTYGSHRWLWETRFQHARAELALAREHYAEAVLHANDALASSRATERRKYEIRALETRARIFAAQDQRADALTDLQMARARADVLRDPLLQLDVRLTMFKLTHDEPTGQDARARMRQICAALPDENLRARFQAVLSEWI